MQTVKIAAWRVEKAAKECTRRVNQRIEIKKELIEMREIYPRAVALDKCYSHDANGYLTGPDDTTIFFNI